MKSMNVYDLAFPALRGSIVSDPFSLLDRFFTEDAFFGQETRGPVVDFREEKDSYLIDAELPGMNEKDIKLELKDNVLTMTTVKDEEKEEESGKGRWMRRERRSFSFSRSFAIPEDADSDSVKATFKDGLLTIVLDKKPESAPKVVQVNVN
jgi:HSP20 family protein